MAGEAPAVHPALHADELVLVEPGGAVVQGVDGEKSTAGEFRERPDVGPLGPGESGSFGASWRMRLSADSPRARDGAWDTVVIGIQGVARSSDSRCAQGVLGEIDDDGTAVVTNNSHRRVTSIAIWRTGYDPSGTVVASDFTSLLGTSLQVGESAREGLNPSSNPRARSTTFNYYVGVDEPSRWIVRVCGGPVG